MKPSVKPYAQAILVGMVWGLLASMVAILFVVDLTLA